MSSLSRGDCGISITKFTQQLSCSCQLPRLRESQILRCHPVCLILSAAGCATNSRSRRAGRRYAPFSAVFASPSLAATTGRTCPLLPGRTACPKLAAARRPLPRSHPRAPDDPDYRWRGRQGHVQGNSDGIRVNGPAAGTLVARVDWDVWFNGTLLVLEIDGTQFKPVPPDWAPVVGKVRVAAGQTCRLVISPGGSDWIYNDPFVLTTSIE